MMKGEEV